MRVTCIGAGPAGLTTAIALRLHAPAAQVRVLERRPPREAAGFGLVFWDNLLDALRPVDLVLASRLQAAAFPWHDQVLRVDGGPPLRSPARGYGIDRGALLGVLGAHAAELGVELVPGRSADLAAAAARSDVVVAADGAGSPARAALASRLGVDVHEGGNVYVWLGLDRALPSFVFGLRRLEGRPIWVHAYGYASDRSTVVVECSAATSRALGLGSQPAPQALAVLEAAFREELDGGRLLSGGIAGPLPWRRFRTISCRRWSAGAVVLAGDAAHTAHFSIGSGTRLAIEDGLALGRALADAADPQRAFVAYQAERAPAVRAAQLEASRSARWFERIERCAQLPPEDLFRVLLARRSRLQAVLPPRTYLALRRG